MAWTRRRVVGTVGVTAALAGCLGESGTDDSPDANGTDGSPEANGTDDANETEGSSDAAEREQNASAALEGVDLEDRTGQEEVTITVDPEGDGFDPAAFAIDPETLLVWEWAGSSTEPYPIDVPEACIWDEEVSEETVDDQSSGDAFDRLFTVPGPYLYASRDADGEEFTGAFRVVEGGDGEESDE